MYTYRWQRRLLGAILFMLLAALCYALFEVYNTRMAQYLVYGFLVFLFATCSVCLFVSGTWYLIKHRNLAKKNLL